jgi:hypothetical protein
LRARADTGDRLAADRLAGLPPEHGDLDELRARIDVGDGAADWRLVEVLIKQGRVEEAERLRRSGLGLEPGQSSPGIHSGLRRKITYIACA